LLINHHGTINSRTAKEIGNLIQHLLVSAEEKVMKIEGEEDLLALPAIMLAPLGAVVVYGLRNKGAVVVKVSEKLKENINKKYLSKFIPF
jgi:hypothetical protein